MYKFKSKIFKKWKILGSYLSVFVLIPILAFVSISCSKSFYNTQAEFDKNIANKITAILNASQNELDVCRCKNLNELTANKAIEKNNQKIIINFFQSTIGKILDPYGFLVFENNIIKINPNSFTLTDFKINNENTTVTAKIVYQSTENQFWISNKIITFKGFKNSINKALIAEKLAMMLLKQKLNIDNDDNLKNLIAFQAIQNKNQPFLVHFLESYIKHNPHKYKNLLINDDEIQINPKLIGLTDFNFNSTNDDVSAKITYANLKNDSSTKINFTGFQKSPSNNVIALAITKIINDLPKFDLDIANFDQTRNLQYIDPNYKGFNIRLIIQSFIRNLIIKNLKLFDNIKIFNHEQIDVDPQQVFVSYIKQFPSNKKTIFKTDLLDVSINYNSNKTLVQAPNSSQIILSGFDGFDPIEQAKITKWFNQPKTQINLMILLLKTKYGHKFLANFLNQNFNNFIIMFLGQNFKIKHVGLNNDIKMKNNKNVYSSFVITIKTSAKAEYSNNWNNGWQNLEILPSGSIINFDLPLTFKIPALKNNQNIWQPRYIIKNWSKNLNNINSSSVLINSLNQFNPLITWAIPTYTNGENFPISAGRVGTIGAEKNKFSNQSIYTLSINSVNKIQIVNSVDLILRFAQFSTQTAYIGNKFNSTSWIQMPKFQASTSLQIANVFNDFFNQILKIINS